MRGRFGNVCLGIAFLAVGYGCGRHSIAVVHAQDSSQFGHSTIPKSWGHVAAATGNFLVLEDDLGNIHMYNLMTHQYMGDLTRRPGQ